MKKGFSADIVAFLAGMVLICGMAQNASANDTENWHEPASEDDFIGRWEGHVVMQIPRNPEAFIPETSLDLSIFLEYTKNAGTVNDNLKLTIKVDVDRMLTDWLNEPLIKMMGLSKDDLWAFFIEGMDLHEETANMTAEKYYLSYAMSMSGIDALNNDISLGILLINDNKTKIKLIFTGGLSLGLGDEGFSEIILDKQ